MGGAASGPRGSRPVLGRWTGDTTAAWLQGEDNIFRVWPTDMSADVRLYGSPNYVLQALNSKRLLAAWVNFQEGDLSRKTFYRSIDFYVHYPQRSGVRAEELPILEAMAAGCIPVLLLTIGPSMVTRPCTLSRTVYKNFSGGMWMMTKRMRASPALA
ncbi:hypothetical protein [Nesterenkonia pannonica]|uniref:hypothetical protein n=1 Tax=Nesterenkonia pannonica TaxID=1548602 RepID=UPI0021642C42|nr:hypothetical protein [Nesterenkonia pannonica]